MIAVTAAASDGPAEWLTAIGTLALALVTVATLIVTVRIARTDRTRDDTKRQEDREHDAELRRQDRERDDQLRREADEKWEQRRRDEQRQREDDDAQQNVIVEFLPGGPLSTEGRAVTTGDGVTHRIVVTTTAAYPVKQLDARIAHRGDSGIGTTGTGWTFGPRVTQNGQVRYTCNAAVSLQLTDAAPIVRFTDRNGNLYYSYLGYARRFSQNTEFCRMRAPLRFWLARRLGCGWLGLALPRDRWCQAGSRTLSAQPEPLWPHSAECRGSTG